MLVRIVALALVGWAVAELSLYWLVCRHDHASPELLKVAVKSLPLVAGAAILIKSRPLAEWLSDRLDL